MSGPECFFDRLKHEGRWHEFTKARQKTLEASSTGTRNKALRLLLDDWGYGGPNQEGEAWERVECRRRFKEEKDAADRARKAETSKKWRKNQRIGKIEDKIADLPESCDPQTELDWIASHPVMIKAIQDPEKPPTVTAKDIDERCPSKAAAFSLISWARRPDTFCDHRMSEMKKTLGKKREATSEDGTEHDNMESINRLWEHMQE